MKRALLWLITIALIPFSCSSKKGAEEIYPPVFYQIAGESNMGHTQVFPGVVFPANQAKLAFKVPGTIEKIYTKMGDTVGNGSLLAVLDNKDYTINYNKALSAFKGAEAGYVTAKSSFARAQRLYINGNIPLADYDKAKLAMESARSAFDAAGLQVQGAGNQLDYTRLRAPFAGVVTSVALEEGELAGAGYPVVIFSSVQGSQIRCSLPGSVVKGVSVGDTLSFYSGDDSQVRFGAVVAEIGKGSGASLAYPVVVDMLEGASSFLPGSSVMVDFSGREQGMVVPSHALGHDSQGSYLFLAQSDSASGVYNVVQRRVEAGSLTWKGYEIVQGISAGDIVITAGLSNLYEGKRVRLIEEN